MSVLCRAGCSACARLRPCSGDALPPSAHAGQLILSLARAAALPLSRGCRGDESLVQAVLAWAADDALLQAMKNAPWSEGVSATSYFQGLEVPAMLSGASCSSLRNRWLRLEDQQKQAKNKKTIPGWEAGGQRMRDMELARQRSRSQAAVDTPRPAPVRPKAVLKAGDEYIEIWDLLIPKLRVEARAHFLPKGEAWVPDGGAFVLKSVLFWRLLFERMERDEERRAGASSRI